MFMCDFLCSSDKHIKELKEKILRCKGNPHLEKVDDVNVICGALKDFLRGLREPLLTYHLHAPFTAAAGKSINGCNVHS